VWTRPSSPATGPLLAGRGCRPPGRRLHCRSGCTVQTRRVSRSGPLQEPSGSASLLAARPVGNLLGAGSAAGMCLRRRPPLITTSPGNAHRAAETPRAGAPDRKQRLSPTREGIAPNVPRTGAVPVTELCMHAGRIAPAMAPPCGRAATPATQERGPVSSICRARTSLRCHSRSLQQPTLNPPIRTARDTHQR